MLFSKAKVGGSSPPGSTLASIPERSKGRDLRSRAIASWVRIPLDAPLPHSVMVNIWPFQGRARGSIPRVGNFSSYSSVG